MTTSRTSSIRFGSVAVLPTQRRVLVDGEPVRVGARAFDVLQALLARRGDVLSKRELLHAVWQGVFVEENNLQVQVCSLRKVLGASAIVTVPGRGYAFDGSIPVHHVHGPVAPRPRSPLVAVPADVAPLRGRAAECAALAQLTREHRMVTVTGPGGIGKTRIVREVLGGSGTVLRVELALLPPDVSVVACVANALGLEFGTQPSAQQVARAAAHVKATIVLENAELFPAESAAVVDALMEATQLRVVSTAQVLLHSRSEHVFRLVPLTVPAPNDSANVNASPAIALLFDTVSALKSRREFSEQELHDAAAICRHLDGNPLAIALAAPRVELLGVGGLRRRLGERFQLLRASTRNTAARQQSLLATMAWSWRLLTQVERDALRVLAQFAGRFTFNMARRALAVDARNEWDAMQVLEGLVDKSAVIAEPDGRSAFRIPESMRLFAQRGADRDGCCS
jgi:predicted ATPase/DNA-binding winged helix-turn-helix (wHTH) protein